MENFLLYFINQINLEIMNFLSIFAANNKTSDMKERKYKLTDETKGIYGTTLHRIVALQDFSELKEQEVE